MKSLTAIIWDWNGTLLDDVDYAIGCMNKLLERRGMPRLSRERYRRIFGFPVEQYYQRLVFDFTQEPFAELSREFIGHYYRELMLPGVHEGARELVTDLNRAGIEQCILSAMEREPLQHQLASNGFLERMAYIQGLDHSHATSKIREGELLIERLDHPKQQILFIGDTLHDREVGEALGLETVVLTHGHQSPDIFAGGRNRQLRDFDALRGYLRERHHIPDGSPPRAG
ncbi:MAG: HAD family hydrolase [Fidelibacterota bacterium]|nr:MAG: HAD family hydrolase [Candidatus Neomarinimicrobiota bacterium]